MKKNKEHKKGESTIGKIIYSFLLFMPLFAIGVTCGYAMFNKNAYRSYSDEYIEQYVTVSSQNQLVENNTYQIIYDSNITGNYSPNFTIKDTNLYTLLDIEDKVIVNVAIINETNYARININFSDSTMLRVDNWNQQFDSFYFTLTTTNYNANNTMNRCKLYQIVWNTRRLDNVFYYAVDKVTESPLFSWATNSVIYTTMNTTCTQLSITAQFIPLLLSYWLIISVIYFLYDIALMLIWLLHDKIHELRDSLA